MKKAVLVKKIRVVHCISMYFVCKECFGINNTYFSTQRIHCNIHIPTIKQLKKIIDALSVCFQVRALKSSSVPITARIIGCTTCHTTETVCFTSCVESGTPIDFHPIEAVNAIIVAHK